MYFVPIPINELLVVLNKSLLGFVAELLLFMPASPGVLEFEALVTISLHFSNGFFARLFCWIVNFESNIGGIIKRV